MKKGSYNETNRKEIMTVRRALYHVVRTIVVFAIGVTLGLVLNAMGKRRQSA